MLALAYLFMYFRLHWVFTQGLSLAAASGAFPPVVVCGVRAPCCGAQSLGHAGSVIVVHGLSWPEECGIFPDQGLNRCTLHWQVES